MAKCWTGWRKRSPVRSRGRSDTFMNGKAVAPVLIFTCGNPSRGDDALGPAMYELLQKEPPQRVDVLTDFQLQIEHALDLEQRKYVLFVDASTSCKAPFEISEITACRDDSFSTHSMTPAAVLAVYRQVRRKDPPAAFLLAIRAYEFGLGNTLTAAARKNLQASHEFLLRHPPWAGFV